MPRHRGSRSGNAVGNAEESRDEHQIIVRPKEKEPQQSILDYLDYFKRIMRVNHWTDENAGDIFCALLGPNDRCIDALHGEWNSFSELEELLRMKEQPMRDANLTTLMDLTMKENETVDTLRDRIMRLVSLVYGTFTKEQQCQITRDFFLHALPSSIKIQVLGAKPLSLDDTVSIAKSSQMVAKKMEMEIVAAFDPSKKQYPKQKQSSVRCYKCGGIGHMRKDCPNEKFVANIQNEKTCETTVNPEN